MCSIGMRLIVLGILATLMSSCKTNSPMIQGGIPINPVALYEGSTVYELTPARGKFVEPSGEGPFPAVILMHGCSGIGRHITIWSDILIKQGYATFAVDSHGPRGVTRNCGTDNDELHEIRSVDDIRGAVAVLRTMPQVRPDQIFALGWSRGGNLALDITKYRGTDPILQSLAGTVAFYPACGGWELTEQYNLPLLVLSASDDIWQGAIKCQRLYDRALENENNDVRLHIYQDATHAFDCDGVGSWVFPETGDRFRCSPSAFQDSQRRVISFLDEFSGL